MGSTVKIKCVWATGRCPDSAQSSSAEILKSYDNKIKLFPQEATLREHSTCTSMYCNLHWAPSRNWDQPLARDRGKKVGYWTASETCWKRSQKQKNIFPRKLPIVKVWLWWEVVDWQLQTPKSSLLFPGTAQVITAYTSSQYIFHQSGWVNFWKIKCIQSLAFLLPQQIKRSIWGLHMKNCFTENC